MYSSVMLDVYKHPVDCLDHVIDPCWAAPSLSRQIKQNKRNKILEKTFRWNMSNGSKILKPGTCRNRSFLSPKLSLSSERDLELREAAGWGPGLPCPVLSLVSHKLVQSCHVSSGSQKLNWGFLLPCERKLRFKTCIKCVKFLQTLWNIYNSLTEAVHTLLVHVLPVFVYNEPSKYKKCVFTSGNNCLSLLRFLRGRAQLSLQLKTWHPKTTTLTPTPTLESTR